MDTKTVKGKIRFEKGVENEVYKYEIDKVWVQFRGLPKELREFSIIWAIGSILGVPRAVDTKFTNKFGRSRMKVAVLDPDLIPDLVDVVIGDFVYELQFRVEKDMLIGEPEVIDMNTNMDEDKLVEDKKPENMDEDGKKFEEPSTDHASNQLPAGPGAVGEQQQALSEVVQQDAVGNAGSDLAKSKKPAVVLTPIAVTSTGTAQWKADLMPT